MSTGSFSRRSTGIDHPARILDAIQQRRRALEHFDALGGGIQRAALHQRHAVLHDRTVSVVTKTPQHHRVLGAAQGVGLGDATDVGQGIVEVARLLIAHHLGRYNVDSLWGFQQQAVGTHHRTGRRAGAVAPGRGAGGRGAAFAAGKQQLPGHRIGAVVGGADGHLLAGLEAVRVFEDFFRQVGRRGIARDFQGLLGTHLARRAMPETQHPGIRPSINGR